MNCAEIIIILEQETDVAQADAAAFEQHLATCQQCTALLNDLEAQTEQSFALLAQSNARPPIATVTALYDQIMGQPQQPRFWQTRAVRLLQLAAIAVLLVWVGSDAPNRIQIKHRSTMARITLPSASVSPVVGGQPTTIPTNPPTVPVALPPLATAIPVPTDDPAPSPDATNQRPSATAMPVWSAMPSEVPVPTKETAPTRVPPSSPVPPTPPPTSTPSFPPATPYPYWDEEEEQSTAPVSSIVHGFVYGSFYGQKQRKRAVMCCFWLTTSGYPPINTWQTKSIGR